MYNLIEYNYSERTGSLWFYSKNETTDFNADIANDIILYPLNTKHRLSAQSKSS